MGLSVLRVLRVVRERVRHRGLGCPYRLVLIWRKRKHTLSHALALSHVRLERLVLEEEGWTRTAERGWPWRVRESASASCGGEALVVDAACGRTVRKAGAESSRRGLRTAQDARRAIGRVRAR